MDLFTPIVDSKRLHPNFRYMLEDRNYYARKVILNWADGFVDRDKKFVLEFQTTFNSSFWELYLYACLKDFGLSVDFSKTSPDFVITNPQQPFCIEATTANSAKDTMDEWEQDINQLKKLSMGKIIDFATIRVASALTSKNRKYDNTYANLGHVKGRPFVVAVAPFEQPFFHFQNFQAILRVLYGYKGPVFEMDGNISPGYPDLPTFITHVEKPNGAQVPVSYFTNETLTNISAVIFNSNATMGKIRALSEDPGEYVFIALRYNEGSTLPYRQVATKEEYHETLLDGLHILHNPYANIPLDYEVFNRPEVIQYSFDIEEQVLLYHAADGALIHRAVVKIEHK